MRVASLLAMVALVVSACAGSGAGTSASASSSPAVASGDPGAPISRLTCGGGPAFDIAALDRPGAAELGADPAAVALRAHVTGGGMETEWLPDAGWIEASRSANEVMYLAHGEDGSLYRVTVGLAGGEWRVDGWGGCNPQPDLPPGVNLATFRVAPGAALDAHVTEIEVLVTETACNSGQDARGRILPPQVISDVATVTVVMIVRARVGAMDCQSNPETPFLLELPEPLGDRALLDGSSVPPRDATTCPDVAMCP